MANKESLSQADECEMPMLTKGVLLTHEEDVRKFTRRRSLQRLFDKVLYQKQIDHIAKIYPKKKSVIKLKDSVQELGHATKR